jgi:hypothetical protein
MSDCKSAAMTNLEVKARQKDPENVIASSLAHLTGQLRVVNKLIIFKIRDGVSR